MLLIVLLQFFKDHFISNIRKKHI